MEQDDWWGGGPAYNETCYVSKATFTCILDPIAKDIGLRRAWAHFSLTYSVSLFSRI